MCTRSWTVYPWWVPTAAARLDWRRGEEGPRRPDTCAELPCSVQSQENAQGLRVTHLRSPYLCHSPVWGLGQKNSAPESPHLPPTYRWFEA